MVKSNLNYISLDTINFRYFDRVSTITLDRTHALSFCATHFAGGDLLSHTDVASAPIVAVVGSTNTWILGKFYDFYGYWVDTHGKRINFGSLGASATLPHGTSDSSMGLTFQTDKIVAVKATTSLTFVCKNPKLS